MLIDDVAIHLASFGAYTQAGATYSIQRGVLPDEVVESITLQEIPAGKAIRAMGPSLGAPIRERAGLRVTVRGALGDYQNPRIVAELVHTRLDGLNATLSGRRYWIQALHPPVLDQQDRNVRWRLVATYYVEKERG